MHAEKSSKFRTLNFTLPLQIDTEMYASQELGK